VQAHFFESSAERIAAQAQEAQARAQASARFQQELRNGGTPMAQVPQSVAAMEPPKATARSRDARALRRR
jgi:outer membrane lipoprotein-sorting protein